MSGARCECAVCVRSAGLTALIDNAKLGKSERGALLDLVADWWALAHGPEENQQKAAKSAKADGEGEWL